jgi:hypothetical protein
LPSNREWPFSLHFYKQADLGFEGGCFCLSRDILHLFCIEKQGLAMRLGKEGGSVAALLKNQVIF